jgi:hypothetical protein
MRQDGFDIHTLIDDLTGTCKSYEEALPDDMYFEDLTEKELATLDGEIFRCAECDWWFEVSEMNGIDTTDHFCRDCRPDDSD